MDPVTTFVNVYLLTIGEHISTSHSERSNLHVTPIVMQYKGSTIPYQHQIWRIKDKSVCFEYQDDTAQYSQCTITAKALFKDMCSELSMNKSQHWNIQKHKTMYCNAALSYKPTVATITSGSNSKNTDADKKCNEFILMAMGSRDKALIAERDKYCDLAKG